MAHGTRPARLGTFLAMSVGCCLVGQAALASEAPSAPVARAMSNGHLDQKGSSASESTPPRGTGDGALVATATDGADEPSTKDSAHTDSNKSGVVIESDDDDDFGPQRVRTVAQVPSAEQGGRERDEDSRRRLEHDDGYIAAYTYTDY